MSNLFCFFILDTQKKERMGTTQSTDDSVSDSMEPHTSTTIKTSLFEATYSIENIYDDDENDNDNQETNDGARVSITLEEDVVLDDKADPTFPWLPILECVAETLGCGVVRTYNLAEAKTIMLSASRYPLVVPDLIVLEEEKEKENGERLTTMTTRRKSILRWSSMEGPWSRAHVTNETPQLPSMLHYAGALLRSDVNLSKLRFNTVRSSFCFFVSVSSLVVVVQKLLAMSCMFLCFGKMKEVPCDTHDANFCLFVCCCLLFVVVVVATTTTNLFYF